MNKKALSLRDFIVYTFFFILYLGGFLGVYFSSTFQVDSSLKNYEETVLNLYQEEKDNVIEIFRNDERYIAIFDSKKLTFVSNHNESGDYKEEIVNKKLSSSFEENVAGINYRLNYFKIDNGYLKIGVSLPKSLIISKWFLIAGTPILFLVFLLSYLFMSKKIKNSFLALNSQVRRLEEVGGLAREEGKYQDSIDLLTKAVRQSRKAVDKELKEAELARQKNDFILDSFSQALIVINGDFKIEIFNKKAAEVFGISQKDALGMKANFLDKYDSELARKAHLAMNALISSTTFEKIDNRVFETSIEPLDFSWTQGEKVNGVSLLLVDVTESYHSSSMKRDFFANASHELKSPLTSILGYQEMIRNGIFTTKEEIGLAVNKTIKEAKRMNKIIMDMLTISNLENENLRPIEEIPVSKAIDEILSSSELLLQEKKITVHHQTSPLILKMNSDDFEKLFRNLIENAIRYNKENGEIFIAEDNVSKTISVADTGIGIKKEDCARIFERFYRVDKARSRENGGTGLGLAIAKYVCSYYHFTIEVKSELGRGTVFIIRTKSK